eukprot:2620321-Pyramimonas_sp.AAC.1
MEALAWHRWVFVSPRWGPLGSPGNPATIDSSALCTGAETSPGLALQQTSHMPRIAEACKRTSLQGSDKHVHPKRAGPVLATAGLLPRGPPKLQDVRQQRTFGHFPRTGDADWADHWADHGIDIETSRWVY